MSKIQKAPIQIQYFEQNPKTVEIAPAQKESNQIVLIQEKGNESLSETRAVRDGIDYGVFMRYEVEDSYKEKKGNNGKGWGKGGKKEALENLEAELQQILAERVEQAEQAAQETVKAEIKREEIRDDQIREDVQNSEEKIDVRKSEINFESNLNETIKKNFTRPF